MVVRADGRPHGRAAGRSHRSDRCVVATAVFIRPGASPWLLSLLLAGYGLGLGLASAQLTGTVLRDIPTEQSGQSSATQSTVRQVGSALGTAVIGAVLAASLQGCWRPSSTRFRVLPRRPPSNWSTTPL